MRAHVMAAAAGLLVVSTAIAGNETEAPKSWVFEPSTFIGINLGGDFLTELPECSADSETTEPRKLCRISTPIENSYRVDGIPYLGFGGRCDVEVRLLGAKVASIRLSGDSEDISRVTQYLRKNYDEPTSIESSQSTTASGAWFTTEVLRWDGSSTSIELRRKEDDFGVYQVTLTNLRTAPKIADEGATHPSDGT
ncbi:hypothetical protein [Pseudomonas sp. SBB6]|uniref:hypothetical protein n=1 Tax=Pseudomonas sp. SBB6 TaxID=2962032 RepID=UPI0020B698EC|nr:hypothetical protein [Pseudomonas sp. SBB6]MCP3750805.1 hypothetical protein [Pseudomonas sp. SBB6]